MEQEDRTQFHTEHQSVSHIQLKCVISTLSFLQEKPDLSLSNLISTRSVNFSARQVSSYYY